MLPSTHAVVWAARMRRGSKAGGRGAGSRPARSVATRWRPPPTVHSIRAGRPAPPSSSSVRASRSARGCGIGGHDGQARYPPASRTQESPAQVREPAQQELDRGGVEQRHQPGRFGRQGEAARVRVASRRVVGEARPMGDVRPDDLRVGELPLDVLLRPLQRIPRAIPDGPPFEGRGGTAAGASRRRGSRRGPLPDGRRSRPGPGPSDAAPPRGGGRAQGCQWGSTATSKFSRSPFAIP